MLTGKGSALFAYSRFRQPALEFLQRDVVTVTLLFLLPGLLAPGREFIVGDAAGLDPGEALLVLLAVGLEHRVFRLFFCPLSERADITAGLPVSTLFFGYGDVRFALGS